MSQHDDRARLRHMLDAAREAMSFIHGRTRQDLDHDRKLALALIRLIEVTGEAATGVSQQTCQRAPGIPWTSIVGMRHRLIHGYFEVDLDRVWDTVTDDLPALVQLLESAFPQICSRQE